MLHARQESVHFLQIAVGFSHVVVADFVLLYRLCLIIERVELLVSTLCRFPLILDRLARFGHEGYLVGLKHLQLIVLQALQHRVPIPAHRGRIVEPVLLNLPR